jgi:23S rRNA (adenine2030-N6)-methyltransferase
MFSYRHGFHAGNHTDVLKHLVQVQLQAHLAAKEKPYQIVDTHAGAGAYSLSSTFAAKNAEFENGIGRLWQRTDMPASVAEYVAQVRKYNPDGALRYYPGSPQLAYQMMREQDRLRLFELHSTEIGVLQNHFADAGRRVTVQAADGFAGLKSVLPPPSRRGLVLIDPSYEDKGDYRGVLVALRDALERFATGTYAVWYPQVMRRDAQELPGKLQRLAAGDWLNVSLKAMAPPNDGVGLYGSGVFVFNPPWKLEAALRSAMPYLVKTLAQDSSAAHSLQFRQT